MKTRLLLAAALALAACSKAPVPADQPAGLSPVDMGNHPTLTPLPDPDLQGGHVGRAPRRITVAQLKASIQVTTGTQWTQIDNLAGSLGKADYALINAEAVEPNLVFAKFLEDGARQVCLKVAGDDLARTNQADRVLSPEVSPAITDLTKVDDDSLKRNLVYLSTRFWGQPLAAPELDTWVTTYKALAAQTVRATTPAPKSQVWGAICVGLMTDPRFFTY